MDANQTAKEIMTQHLLNVANTYDAMRHPSQIAKTGAIITVNQMIKSIQQRHAQELKDWSEVIEIIKNHKS